MTSSKKYDVIKIAGEFPWRKPIVVGARKPIINE